MFLKTLQPLRLSFGTVARNKWSRLCMRWEDWLGARIRSSYAGLMLWWHSTAQQRSAA